MQHRKRALDVLVVYDVREIIDPADAFNPDPRDETWKSERSVIAALKRLGHRVRSIGLFNDVGPLVDAIRRQRPDLVFNLVEEFNERSRLERNVAGLLELLDVPYTGCGSAGILLCKNKALAKTILAQHAIRTAKFVVYRQGARIQPPRGLRYPLFVKPTQDDASTGISQASLVDSYAALVRRVRYIQQALGQDALVEEYVHGRELYVSVMGHKQLEVLPVRELKFRDVPKAAPRIATYKAKWNQRYRKRWGINEEFADQLPRRVADDVKAFCRKAYRALQMDGYGRMDLRLTADGELVFLEANPNPFLAPGEDFAESAKKAGYPFDALLERLLALALHRPAA